MKAALTDQEDKKVVAILIKISELDNLKYLLDEEVDLKVSVTFMNVELPNEKTFKSNDANVQLQYQLKINVNDDEEVFNLFTNPIQSKNFEINLLFN